MTPESPTDKHSTNQHSNQQQLHSASNQSPTKTGKMTKSKRSPKRKAKSKQLLPHQHHHQQQQQEETNEPFQSLNNEARNNENAHLEQEQHQQQDLPETNTHETIDVSGTNEEPHVELNEENDCVYNDRSKSDELITREFQKRFEELSKQLSIREAQIEAQNNELEERLNKIRELETVNIGINRRCAHFDNLLKQQLLRKTALENENQHLNHTLSSIRSQLNDLERFRSKDEEKINLLNATLIERETEVSFLKLKLTRVQTNLANSVHNNANDAGLTSSSKLEAPLANPLLIRQSSNLEQNHKQTNSLSTQSPLISFDRNSAVWSQVSQDLCPNRRPELLDGLVDSTYVLDENQTSTPRRNNRRYQTLPAQRRVPVHNYNALAEPKQTEPNQTKEMLSGVNDKSNLSNEYTKQCQVTNLDDSNSTNHSNGIKTGEISVNQTIQPSLTLPQEATEASRNSNCTKLEDESVHQNNMSLPVDIPAPIQAPEVFLPPSLPPRTSSSPVKSAKGFRRFFDKFMRSGSSMTDKEKTNQKQEYQQQNQIISAGLSPFRRGNNRSTMVGVSTNLSPLRQEIKTDKPFAEWSNEMIADWLIMIGLSMYANQCRRWIKSGVQIMNATPAEVDRGLGITNPLHRKKLRLAISELNGDCDKVTKAASKLDYLRVARWLDDIGLPQYKDKFIEARIDGRVLNYLTVEDLASMNITSVLHHASIRCGIKVLRSINFDLQMLKRRAASEEIANINSIRQQILENQVGNESGINMQGNESNDNELALWTCHRVMEWLRLIDFAEYSSNLRGSGLNGSLIVYEDGFNADTMCSILIIPDSKTLLRRHMKTFFTALIGKDLATRKHLYQFNPSHSSLTLSAEIKSHKRSQFSLLRLKSSKVAQDSSDEYLCPMYPPESCPFSPAAQNDNSSRKASIKLAKIPETVGS